MNAITRHSLRALAAVVCALTTSVVAQDFRVESEVGLKDEKQPFSENLTLFSDGLVYDFMLTKPNEMAIYDPDQGQFSLLDPTRKVKLTITCDDILSLIAALKSSEHEAKDPFLFAPLFNVSFDLPNNLVTLASDRVTYRVKGLKPPDARVVLQYRRFADWYARLNATVPGHMPPFARIEMNKEVAARGFMPEQVELTLKGRDRNGPQKTEITSRHLVVWELSSRDREKIASAEADHRDFRAVGFKEYHRLK